MWNIKNLECILNIQNIYEDGAIYSACFLNNNNLNYIISSNCNNYGPSQPIKIFDINGNMVKEINDSNDYTYFIDKYYDIKTSKNYIITANFGNVKSYDFHKNKRYHKYYDKNKNRHFSIAIDSNENIIKLFESSCDGNIRIWNFHTSELLKKIKVCDNLLYGICIWNNKNLFVGCEDKTIKLIDLSKGKIVNSLIGHKEKVINLKKLKHPKYGECLISQGSTFDQIKLWAIND